MEKAGYIFYLMFMISWFLHLGNRMPMLGENRVDLVLVFIILLIIVEQRLVNNKNNGLLKNEETSNYLTILIIFIIVTIPFVEWPGSVINYGIEGFAKAVVFYYFTVIFVNTENKLKLFILVFLLCQIFRVGEPLYLHHTQGYWGSQAFMAGEFMDRLAGSIYDTASPNGLAYIIVSILPFLHFFSSYSWVNKLIYLLCAPFLIYALVLTGSRAGFLGLLIFIIGIFIKTEHKGLFVLITLMVTFAIFINLSEQHKDRYLSLISSSTKNSATAEGRFEGLKNDFQLALHNPIVGHGIGTSSEANYHYSGSTLRSHNLYTEIAQEIGFVGLIIYLFFMKATIVNIIRNYKTLNKLQNSNKYLKAVNNTMQVLLVINLVLSLAGYGLSTNTWYLFAGLAVVISRLSYQLAESSSRNDLYI